MANGSYNPYENAQAQFDESRTFLAWMMQPKSLLRQPMKEYHFTIPVKMDDGSTKVFNGYRIQHMMREDRPKRYSFFIPRKPWIPSEHCPM
jgi:glutamate dehydrogenase (NAD(P)+)